MPPSVMLSVITRCLQIAFAVVIAWTIATAAIDAIDAADQRAQAEIDAGSPRSGATSYNAKDLSVDRSVPWN